MSLYRSKKKYKIRLFISYISYYFFNLYFFPKKTERKSRAKSRIYTCQPNFTTVYDNQYFKIKRLFYGFLTQLKTVANMTV